MPTIMATPTRPLTARPPALNVTLPTGTDALPSQPSTDRRYPTVAAQAAPISATHTRISIRNVAALVAGDEAGAGCCWVCFSSIVFSGILRSFEGWQGGRDSNSQPSVLETDSLPIDLPPYGPRSGVYFFFSLCPTRLRHWGQNFTSSSFAWFWAFGFLVVR